MQDLFPILEKIESSHQSEEPKGRKSFSVEETFDRILERDELFSFLNSLRRGNIRGGFVIYSFFQQNFRLFFSSIERIRR